MELLALKKHEVQKHFKDKLEVPDILTFTKHNRAIMDAISSEKLTSEERSQLVLSNLENDAADFVKKDYFVMRKLDDILRHIGFTGVFDCSTEIAMDKIGDNFLATKLQKIEGMVTGVRARATDPKTLVPHYLKSYMGLKFNRKRVGKKNHVKHTLEEDTEV